MFLLFHDLELEKWAKTLEDSHSAYAAMKEHFLKSPSNSEDLATVDDPLTDSDSVSKPAFLAHEHHSCMPGGGIVSSQHFLTFD